MRASVGQVVVALCLVVVVHLAFLFSAGIVNGSGPGSAAGSALGPAVVSTPEAKANGGGPAVASIGQWQAEERTGLDGRSSEEHHPTGATVVEGAPLSLSAAEPWVLADAALAATSTHMDGLSDVAEQRVRCRDDASQSNHMPFFTPALGAELFEVPVALVNKAAQLLESEAREEGARDRNAEAEQKRKRLDVTRTALRRPVEVGVSGERDVAAIDRALGPSAIPRRVFWTSKSRTLGMAGCGNIREVARLNPEWDLHLFGDDEARAVIWSEERLRPLLPLLDAVSSGAVKADLWRYVALFLYGGVYVDLDSQFLVPLRELIPRDVTMLGARMPDSIISQWAIAVRAKHPVMQIAAKQAFSNVLEGLARKGKGATYEFKGKKYLAGPPVLSKAFAGFSSSRLADRTLIYQHWAFDRKLRSNVRDIKREQAKDGVHWTNRTVSAFRASQNRSAFQDGFSAWNDAVEAAFSDWPDHVDQLYKVPAPKVPDFSDPDLAAPHHPVEPTTDPMARFPATATTNGV